MGISLSPLGSYLTIIGLLVFTSCSSSLTRPPESSFRKEQDNKITSNPSYLADVDLNRLEENERQYLVFKSAENFEKIGKTKAACDRFKYLGSDKTFPLQKYALIRSLKICDYLGLKAIMLWKSALKDIPSYYKKEFLENSRILALKKNLFDYYVDFSLQLTETFELHTEKEKHIKALLAFAKKNKLSTQLDKIRAKLEETSPRYIKNAAPGDFLRIAKDYSRIRAFKSARSYYQKAIRSSELPPKERIDAFKRFCMTYKLQRQKKQYSWKMESLVKWLKKEQEWLKDPEIKKEYEEIRILSARAQWTVNYRSRAEKTLERIIADPETTSDTWAHAYWLLGKIAVEKKKLEEAQEYFQTGLSKEVISDDVLEMLSWSLGWSYYLEEKYHKAKDLFFLSEKRSKDNGYKRKLRFWQAKILKKLNQTGEASTIFKEIIEEDPFGYYGVAAAMEEEVPLEVPATISYKDVKSPYPALDWMVAIENYELAEEYLKTLEKEVTDDAEELLPLYHMAKWYEGGIFKFFRFSKEEREEILRDHLPAVFPAPHQSIVKNVSQKLSIPEGIIYAIARQESAFNEKVRSWADAFGLLQVTPEKARSLARKNGIKYKGYDDLYDVKTNLTLGTILLKDLAKKYDGEFISFVASYNAGSKPLQEWQKNRFREDPFEFIEMIPYKETRDYIKLVLRNFSTYQRILGHSWKENKSFFKKSIFL